jgi:O-antigen ligase
MYSVVGIGLISALFGLARHADQSGPGFVLPQLQPQSGFAQFINHNHFVFLAEMSLGLVLGLMLRRPVQFGRLVVGLTIAIPMWIAIVYSGSRGGLACMVAQVLFLALLVFIVRPGRRLLEQRDRQEPAGLSVALGTPIFLIALFLIVMVVGIVWVGGDPLASNLESVANEFGAKEADRYTTTYRSTIWPMTWEMIKDHPFAGVGFGSYWIAITRYHHGSGELTPQQAHNDYLELFASGGAVGCALALWLLVAFLKAVRVRLLSANAYRQAACLGALTGIFGVGLHSFVDFGLHITINSLVFITLMVIATVNERTEKSLPRSRLAAA